MRGLKKRGWKKIPSSHWNWRQIIMRGWKKIVRGWKKFPSSHWHWRQIFVRGWKKIVRGWEKNSILSLELAPKSWEDGNVWIFHVCRLVPEEAIDKWFNSRKVCNATLLPRTTWQQIISHNHGHVQNQTNCTQVYRRQGPKVAHCNNGSTFPSSSRTKTHCNSSG